MANRTTTHVLKNSDIVNRPLPSSLLKGEPIINTADGIMYFSGVTTSTSGWTQSGPTTPTFFEVGSNLYDLKIRNQIKSYSGVTTLDGLFLSGTSNGFVLAPISTIVGVDTYVTGFTYNDNNVLTITQTAGGPTKDVLFNKMSGLTVNGTLSATTANFGTENVTTLNATGGTITTLNSTTINSGAVNVNNLTVTGTATYNQTATAANDIVNLGTLTAYSQTNDVYVTGATYSAASNSSNSTTWTLNYHGTPLNGPYTISGNDTFTTGGTYSNLTKQITFNKNNGVGGNYTVDLSSIDVNDTYVTGGTITTAPSNNSINGQIQLAYNNAEVGGPYYLPFTDVFTTGFTYNPTTSTFTLKDNSGNTFNQSFNTVSGLTVSNLTAGRVVYVGTSGLLTDMGGFEYNAGTKTLSVPTDGAVSVGTGGLSVAGDAVIQGSLTVFGPSVSAFTSQLYVEDDNITLNYNPTGQTIDTSLGAGWTIQDGSGIATTATTLQIGLSYNNTNLTPRTEYTSNTGNANRNFFTQLGDIIIRNTNYDKNSPNGVRVLAENDVLDGGSY